MKVDDVESQYGERVKKGVCHTLYVDGIRFHPRLNLSQASMCPTKIVCWIVALNLGGDPGPALRRKEIFDYHLLRVRRNSPCKYKNAHSNSFTHHRDFLDCRGHSLGSSHEK